LLFIGSGASSFILVKKLKDPVQQKTLIGAAILCMLVGVPFLIGSVNTAIIGLFWFMFKVAVIVYIMIWFRGTFPRFRYDQLMDIGWKYMIPIGIGALVVNAILGMTK
jgi:NADH-quinone oxidoreductase subunit H